MPLTLTARWIFPVASPPLPGGVVTLDAGRVVAVGRHGSATADLDLGDAAVVPGLVNAHAHLDLTAMRGLAPPRLPLPEWLAEVISHRRRVTPRQTEDAVRAGLAEAVRTGTTALGDVSAGGASWPILAASGVRATVYHELLGTGEERQAQALAAFDDWHRGVEPAENCLAGVSPHAPYSAGAGLYEAATLGRWPVVTHLAESREELELLATRSGPFVPFLQRLGVWRPERLADDVAAVCRWLARADHAVIAHGNYLPEGAELPANVSVAYCPRTHAAFGHGPHPWRRLLARGVRVALGTDGLASNPDLDLLAEARFLRRQCPEAGGAALLRMATLSGAEALGWGEVTGSLEAGKSADLAVVSVGAATPADPHDLILAGEGAVARVMCRGRWLA